MCVQRYTQKKSDCLIPSLVKLVKLGAKEKAASIDLVTVQHNIRISEVEFLVKRVNFPNELCTFDGHILGHGVVTLFSISKMLHILHPGQRKIIWVRPTNC